MTRWLKGRAAAGIVMTRSTITGTTGIVSPRAANEGCSGMTEMAIQRGDNVGGVSLGFLTDRDTTIMTRGTIIDDTGMIENRAGEATSGMAGTAILKGRNMIDYFASGEYTIMTDHAVIHDADMLKSCGQKPRGLVALDTITVGWHMVIGFSSGGITIVTRRTVINDALVIKLGTSKGRGGMARRAIQRGRNVGGIDFGILAGRRNTIVAECTVINDTGMIEHRWRKCTAGYVTDDTIFVCVNMVDFRNLASCIGTIVAGIAPITHNVRVGVVDKGGDKYSRVMTYGTVCGGILMNWRIRLSYGSGCNVIHTPIMARGTITGDTHV